MGTSQIAIEACDFRPEGADGHSGRRLSRALSHHRKQQRLNHLVSRALWFGTRVSTDLQQAYGKRGQQTQQADQTVNGLPLPFFNATPTFEALMLVLTQPPMSIPLDPLPGLFKRRGGDRGQQDPFQRLLAFWCLLFPDTHDPHGQGLFARSRRVRVVARASSAQRKAGAGSNALDDHVWLEPRTDGSPGSARTVRASANT